MKKAKTQFLDTFLQRQSQKRAKNKACKQAKQGVDSKAPNIIKKFENHWSKIGYWSKLGATENTLIEILLSWKLSLLKIGLTENGYTENGYTENVLYWGRLIL